MEPLNPNGEPYYRGMDPDLSWIAAIAEDTLMDEALAKEKIVVSLKEGHGHPVFSHPFRNDYPLEAANLRDQASLIGYKILDRLLQVETESIL